MLATDIFGLGLLTPALAYAMSCVGAFIALRCTTRAYAYDERMARLRWLALAAVSLGTTGIWGMHFIGMLGYWVAGMIVRLNVTITIASLVIAVLVVFGGLFIVGFWAPTRGNLLIAGVITGVGVSAMHYVGMAAMEMPATVTYSLPMVALSVGIGIVTATAALWAALRLRGLWSTLLASLIMGLAVSGMHYTGVAAMRMEPMAPGMQAPVTGPDAQAFLLPLLIGIGVVSLVLSAVLAFSATEAEIREDRELMERINAATARLAGRPVPAPAPAAMAGGQRGSNAGGRGDAGSRGADGRLAERPLTSPRLRDPGRTPATRRAPERRRATGRRHALSQRRTPGQRPATGLQLATGERSAPEQPRFPEPRSAPEQPRFPEPRSAPEQPRVPEQGRAGR
jgi:NO-binding membrane sensor protein with MHYT domain